MPLETGTILHWHGVYAGTLHRPSYQDAAVGAYLKKINLNQRLYNAQGRGYPDIAALAHNYYIELNQNVGSEDGTSASSPVMGGTASFFPHTPMAVTYHEQSHYCRFMIGHSLGCMNISYFLTTFPFI